VELDRVEGLAKQNKWQFYRKAVNLCAKKKHEYMEKRSLIIKWTALAILSKLLVKSAKQFIFNKEEKNRKIHE
jgi:hypothetical protein